MSVCCGPVSRRSLLRRAALLAGMPVVSWADPSAAVAAVRASRRAGGHGPVPANLELLTVTPTGFAVRWTTGDPANLDAFGLPTPLPADTRLVVSDVSGCVVAEVNRSDNTAVHLAEVTGLTPGTSYVYVAHSAGRVAMARVLKGLHQDDLGSVTSVTGLLAALDPTHPTSASPGVVTTLTPPPGSLIARLVLSNDLHLGETSSGVLAGNLPAPVRQLAGSPPYPEVMLSALIAAARGTDALLVAGDLTAEAALIDAQRVRNLLQTLGNQALGGAMTSGGWLATRGNHDRLHGTVDTVGEVFNLPLQSLAVHTFRGLRLIGLDTTGAGSGGVLSAAQLADLSAELRRDPDQPTLIFGHHPVTAAAAATTLGGAAFDLEPSAGRGIEAAYSVAPGVFLHHAGHTHRFRRTSSPVATGVEFLEVGAAKEYPGCYAVLEVRTGGYQITTHALPGADALAWSARSAAEYDGYYPSYVLGSVSDRNHVVLRDFSSLGRPVAFPADDNTHHRLAEGLLAGGGLAAAAAVVLARRGKR